MSEPRMYRLTTEDANRVEQLIERIKAETEKQGMKPVKQSTMLRALIFHGKKIETQDLIEAVKHAQIYA